MLTIRNEHTDPYFNLAAEEWLTANSSEEIFMFWRNSPSVIVGRNQNTIAEIDPSFVDRENIAVVRRMSGGGSVFHDLGNINYTYIANGVDGFCDFTRFSEPVIAALNALGVPAESAGRNDITADGKKISGNAQYVMSGRVLHHGTLLYSADLTKLTGALRTDPAKYTSRGIKSVRARVCNIAEFLDTPPAVEDFLEHLRKFTSDYLGAPRPRPLTEQEEAGILTLREVKYLTREWNYGRVSDYGFTKKTRFDAGTLEVCLTARGGTIAEARIFGDFFSKLPVADLEQNLTGVEHTPAGVRAALTEANYGDYLAGFGLEEVVETFF